MLLIVFMSGCKKDVITTGVPPKVTSTDPVNNTTGIDINSKISAMFSVGMDPSTITIENFTLQEGSTDVPGAVTYAGTKATFTPAASLAANTFYTATITTGAKDVSGKSIAKDYIWNLTTGEIADITRPTVTSDPVNNVKDVALNKAIALTFSEPMDPLTINDTTFTLKQGDMPISGAITYSGTKATFTPASNLVINKIYTGTITTGAKDLAGNALASNNTFSFTTVLVPDIELPMVNSNDPLNDVTGFALNKVIAFTFSEPMAPLTINGTTFTLKQGETPVLGTVAYSGNTATFTPTTPLAAGLPYTATITTGATDVAGNALAAAQVLTFTTTDAAPTVISTVPAIDATGVVLNIAVTATFSVPMDPLTLTATTFTIKQGATPVAGTVSYSGSTATFTPAANLAASLIYTATITTGAKNVQGTPLASDYVWKFTTGTTTGTAVGTPDQPATGVPINAVVGLTFSVPMNPATIIAGLTLWDGTTQVAGTVTYSGTTATFTPTKPLEAGKTYTIKLTGAKDLNGITLADTNWTFTTATVASSGPLVVDLKTVARFGILAYAGVMNNAGGASVIKDLDIGVYPYARSSITGFPPATLVGGAIYAADDLPASVGAMLRQAKDDLVAAYNQAAGAILPTPVLVPAGLGGRTLGPGIYKSASSMKLENGNLTLNGDANAVWIFQIGSALITTGGGGGTYGNVILTGGALAKNVFWQVGTSATIGDGTSFKGTVMALTSITMGSGATIEGRMLARTGAVVLTSTNTVAQDIITKPKP